MARAKGAAAIRRMSYLIGAAQPATRTLRCGLQRAVNRGWLLCGDAAGDAIAGVAGGVAGEVIGLGVDDERGSPIVEEGAGSFPEGGAGNHEGELARALVIDGEVGQIAYVRMRILRVVYAVMGAGGVEVTARRGEAWGFTLADVVNMNALLTGCELGDWGTNPPAVFGGG